MNTDKLTLEQLAPYFPYGIEVEYEGILNGDEIKAYYKAFEKEHGDDFFATNQDYYKPPEKIIGKKIGYIKEVGFFLEYTRYRIGKKGLQTHNNTDKFKPVLYPISCLTKEITHNGAIFNPMVELFTTVFGGCYDEDNVLIKFDSNAIKISTSIERLTYYIKEQCFKAESMGDDGETWHPPFNQYILFQKLAEWHINFNGIPEGLYIDADTFENNPYS